MSLYHQRAGQKLKERLELLKKNEAQRFSLLDEIDVARSLCLETVEMYGKVCDKPEVTPETRTIVIEATKNSINNLAALLLQSKKLDMISGHSLSTQHVDAMITKVLRILEQELSEEDAQRVAKRLEEIKLPAADITIHID